MARAAMTFPPDFVWGTATSSHQVEGNNTNNDWWAWEQQSDKILQNDQSGEACNWWRNAEADLDLAAEMGTNAHRMSLEWSRIEPRPGQFDGHAVDRYRQILQGLIDRGLEPMVTLHHFSNPQWLVESGDFNSEAVVGFFHRYTEHIVGALGDLIAKWITINEPMVYLYKRYFEGTFPPPSARGLNGARPALANLLRCHAAAYHAIKETYPRAPVGVAKNMAIFEAPPSGGALDRWWAGQVDKLFNQSWMRAMTDGRLKWPGLNMRIEHLAGTYDFVGINYYTRYRVRFPPGGSYYERDWGPEAQTSDGEFGEVYPYGLYRSIRQALPYEKPIFITGNGLPDRQDALRPAFILDHLRQIWHAISFCYPVMGYYYWSLVDSFEWDRGWTQRFGLIGVDPETQERSWRASGHLYRDICRSYSVSSDMAARYAPQMMEVMFPGGAPSLKDHPGAVEHLRYQDHMPEIGAD